jgi:hypothetical protein
MTKENDATRKKGMPERDKVLSVRRVLATPAAGKVVHNFGWARVGQEILFEVGHFDLFAVSAALQSDSESPVIDWYITDRFVLSLDAAERLVGSLTEIAEELRKLKK